ncbi:hypothetical protein SASPL_134203 [Salvia splendens]|uniref:Uncharacterized protein n=1 Tax=Salvia splendens TaxID=180675 RepID=A0A8X8X587_SALSN|nr:hypothetical protein SASPL_134203 [Salvia splendens]
MKQLHIVMAHGHMIPMIQMAKLFTSRGLKATIISTPSFAAPITEAQLSGFDIGLAVTPFPPQGSSSLPQNVVAFDQMTTPDLTTNFLRATELLHEPFEELLQQLRPDCLVSDIFLPWTADSAAKFRILRLAFYGTSYFTRCVSEQIELHKPFNSMTMSRSSSRTQMNESWKKTYGEVVNSFDELESAYANHYKNVIGRKAWGIGPVENQWGELVVLFNREYDTEITRIYRLEYLYIW